MQQSQSLPLLHGQADPRYLAGVAATFAHGFPNRSKQRVRMPEPSKQVLPMSQKAVSSSIGTRFPKLERSVATSSTWLAGGLQGNFAKLPFLRAPKGRQKQPFRNTSVGFRHAAPSSQLDEHEYQDYSEREFRQTHGGRSKMSSSARTTCSGFRATSALIQAPTMPSLTPHDRKENQKAALEVDRKFVKNLLAQQSESQAQRTERDRQLEDHRWANMFAPLPRPWELLPRIFRLYPAQIVTQNNSSINPRRVDPTSASLSYDDMDDVVKLCCSFNALVTFQKPEDATGGCLAMDRPSFCRLLCALGGPNLFDDSLPLYRHSVDLFDRYAVPIQVKNCSLPSGTVVGLLLSHSTAGMPAIEDLNVCKLFASLLKGMMECADVNISVEEKLAMAKKRLFGQLIPRARRYALQRSEHLEMQILSQQQQTKEGIEGDPADTSPVPEADEEQELEHHKQLDSEKKELEHEKQLYSHTFVVLKGELLASQLLEPEILHIIVEFDQLFQKLFDSYCDVALSPCDGHMTFMGFLRFCSDFGLFPQRVDLQTLQWLYSTAQSCKEVPVVGSLHLLLEPPVEPETCPISTHQSEQVENDQQAHPNGKGGEKAEKLDYSSKKQQNHRKLADNEKGKKDNKPTEHTIVWSGTFIKSSLAWLTENLYDMNKRHREAAAVLWAINDWMTDRRIRVEEVFAFIDEDDNGSISCEELVTGAKFMMFDNPPSDDEVRWLFHCLTAVEEQDIDFSTLSTALWIVHRQTMKMQKTTNCFLKDNSSMSRVEYNASYFFKELMSDLESRNWTPHDLWSRFDRRDQGWIDKKDLTKQTNTFLKLSASASLQIDSPFDLLDVNGDGIISREEFVGAFEMAQEAARMKARDKENSHPIFKCNRSMDDNLARSQGLFGKRAFVECLLKMAFEYLTYHGTNEQAEQSSLFKVMWLLCFLRWQFERRARPPTGRPKSTQGNKRGVVREDPFQGQNFPTYIKPLQRLLKEHPKLFLDNDQTRSLLSPKHWDDSSLFDAKNATLFWGNKADELLKTFWAETHSGQELNATGSRSLDRLLLAAAFNVNAESEPVDELDAAPRTLHETLEIAEGAMP